MLPVKDWMAKPVLTCKKEDSILKVAKKMSLKHVGALIVIDADKKPKGMITEKDILSKVIAEELDTKSVLVKDIMSKKIVTMDVSTSFLALSRKMEENGFRRMPIIENGKLVGIITSSDIIKVMSGK